MRVLRTLLASVLLALAAAVVIGGLTDGFTAFTTETARRVRVHADAPLIPAVALETQAGQRIDLADLRGRWLVVDFIYTRCLTVCLALGSEFAQLQDRLAAPLATGELLLLSISFDPQHDTPERLAAYLRRHGDQGAGWIAVRPVSTDDLHRLTQAFGLIVIDDGLGGYEHNAALQLVDPRGRLVDILDPGESHRIPQRLAARGVAW